MSTIVTLEVDREGQINGRRTCVEKTRPAGLDQHLSNREWNSFCSKFNQELKAANDARDTSTCIKGTILLVFIACMIAFVASTVIRNNDDSPLPCDDQVSMNGYTYTTTNGDIGTMYPMSSCSGYDSSEKADFLGGGQIACIVIMVLLLIIAGSALSVLRNQGEASIEACHRVCEEFSNNHNNMSVRLRTRATGDVGQHYRNLFFGAIYYLEFQFCVTDATPTAEIRPPPIAPLHDPIPMVNEVDVELGDRLQSAVAMIPMAEPSVSVASAPPRKESTTAEASLTVIERLRVLESIKSEVTKDEYKTKQKEILSKL